MIGVDVILRGVVLPATVALAIFLMGGRPWRRRHNASTDWASPLAIGAGFVAGFAASFGWPALPPPEHWLWLCYLACAALVAGVLEVVCRGLTVPRWAVRVITVVAAAWLTVPNWESLADTRVRWTVVAGLMIATNWAALRGADRGGMAFLRVVSLWVIVATASGILVMSGNANLARACGMLAATLGAAAIVAWWRPASFSWTGAAPVLAILVTALTLNGHFHNYGSVPVASFILTGVAPAAVGLCGLAGLSRLTDWKRVAVSVVIALTPVGIALGIAMAAAPTDAGHSLY